MKVSLYLQHQAAICFSGVDDSPGEGNTGYPLRQKVSDVGCYCHYHYVLNAVFSKKIMIKNLFSPLNGRNFVWLKVNLQSNKLKALLLNL